MGKVIDLDTPVKMAVDQYVREAADGSGPSGLWIFGPRFSGTSTAARYVKQALRQYPDIVLQGSACHIRASDLLNKIRREWIQRDVLRTNSSDWAVWQEWSQLDSFFDEMWYGAALTWIDDLFEETDSDFFRKHVLPAVDRRLKEGKLTVISGQVSPEKFGQQWAVAIRSRCRILQRTTDRLSGG